MDLRQNRWPSVAACLLTIATMLVSACGHTAGGSDAAADWRNAKPSEVMAQGLSKTPSDSFKALASQIQAGLTADELAHLAAIDWQHVSDQALMGDPVWRKGVRVARAALAQNPSALAKLWELLGPSSAYAAEKCGAGQNIANNIALAFGTLGVTWVSMSCAAAVGTAGVTLPFCVAGLTISAAILLANTSCDSAADEPTCTPDQLCAGGCPVSGQKCCGGSALCDATSVCLACPASGERCQPAGSTCCGNNLICNASEKCCGTGGGAFCQAAASDCQAAADAVDSSGDDDAFVGADSGDDVDALGDIEQVEDASDSDVDDTSDVTDDGAAIQDGIEDSTDLQDTLPADGGPWPMCVPNAGAIGTPCTGNFGCANGPNGQPVKCGGGQVWEAWNYNYPCSVSGNTCQCQPWGQAECHPPEGVADSGGLGPDAGGTGNDAGTQDSASSDAASTDSVGGDTSSSCANALAECHTQVVGTGTCASVLDTCTPDPKCSSTVAYLSGMIDFCLTGYLCPAVSMCK